VRRPDQACLELGNHGQHVNSSRPTGSVGSYTDPPGFRRPDARWPRRRWLASRKASQPVEPGDG